MIKTSLLTATAVAALGLVGSIDLQAEQDNHSLHCAMVAQWNEDVARGIAPEDRSGWPNYDERECEQ